MRDAMGEALRSGGDGMQIVGRVMVAAGNSVDPGTRRGTVLLRPATLRRLRRLIDQLSEPEAIDGLVEIYRAVVRDSEELRGAFIAWVDLVEVLVQNAERRHPEQGRGPLKSAEVKEVILYLLRSTSFESLDVPRYLEPVIKDVIAEITTKAIVELANDHPELWIDDSPTWRSRLWSDLRWAMRAFRATVKRLLRPLLALGSRLYVLLRFQAPIRPSIRSALEAIERHRPLAGQRGVLRDVRDLKLLIARNRDSVVALVRLIGLVVDEVEYVEGLSGREKKAYAIELVTEILEELGIDTRSLVMSVVIEIGVDFVIDATVHLFHKRDKFVHSGRSRPRPRRRTVVA